MESWSCKWHRENYPSAHFSLFTEAKWWLWQSSAWWLWVGKMIFPPGLISCAIFHMAMATTAMNLLQINYYFSSLLQFSSVQFSRSVVSNSLQPHEPQHARPPCPSTTPRVYSNSYPSSRWCHPAISSTVIPFSSCPQSLPASGSFPMSQLFAWGG